MKTILSPYYKIISKKKRLLQIGLWCNGNTSDFDSEILGSNPSSPTPIFV